MKIVLLCRSPQLYSHQRLIEAARVRGHEIETINHLRCTIDIASHRPKIHYHGKVLQKPDAVIPQATYRVESHVLEPFDCFLVPIGPDAGGMRYEAVFT